MSWKHCACGERMFAGNPNDECRDCRQAAQYREAARALRDPCTSQLVPPHRPEGAAFLEKHEERMAAHEARIHAELDRLEPGWREVQAARRGGRKEACRR